MEGVLPRKGPSSSILYLFPGKFLRVGGGLRSDGKYTLLAGRLVCGGLSISLCSQLHLPLNSSKQILYEAPFHCCVNGDGTYIPVTSHP